MKIPSSNIRPRSIPEASLRRLPIYYRFLQQMAIDGVAQVSCADLSRGLGLDPTQVRKDIESTGIVGKPRVGYPLGDLVRWLENFLGWNRPKAAVLAGARSLELTLELKDLEAPMVVCLNMMDEAVRKGILIDSRALSTALGVTVVET